MNVNLERKRRPRAGRAVIVAVATLAATGAALASWYFLSGPGSEHKATRTVSVPPPSGKPFVAVQPDPRFRPVAEPRIPAVKTEDGLRMISDMHASLRTARCHGEEHESAALPMPGADGNTGPLRQALDALPDVEYPHAALPRVVDPATPAAAMQVLFDDLENRTEEVKLRAYFVIAQIEGHPMAEAALGRLQKTLNVDFKKEWDRWEVAVSERMTRNRRGVRSESCRVHFH